MSQTDRRDSFAKACALQAMYLWQGFMQAGPIPLMDNSDRFGGQIEAAEWLADFSPLMASAFHATHQAIDSFPGVYCYEVTEELGAWLRKNQGASIEQFGAALKLESLSFLSEPCDFLDVVIKQYAVEPARVIHEAPTTSGQFPVVRQQLAYRFLGLLAGEVGLEKYNRICALNQAREHRDICHSHDFVDANVVMAMAFLETTGVEVDTQNDEHTELWSAAWSMATDAMSETSRFSKERWNPLTVSQAFASLLQTLSADDFAALLSNWNESEWVADSEKIVRFPGRDQRFSRGAEGGKITVPKRDLLTWLASDQPLDPLTYAVDKSWVDLINNARSAIALLPTPPSSEPPEDAPAPSAG